MLLVDRGGREMQPRRPHESDREHEGRYEHHDHHHNYSGTVTLKIQIDASTTLTRLIQLVTQQSQQQHGEIMAGLVEIQDATRVSGDAARAAIMRVGEDVQALQQQIIDLVAIVQAGVTGAAELAALKAGLDTAVTDLGAMTADLAGLDPLPGHPAPPPPPPVDPPVEPPTT